MRLARFMAALALAAACLQGGCGSPPEPSPIDAEIERSARSARVAFHKGSADSAAVLYKRALARAKAIDDSIQIGRNAYNLAACLVALGEYDKARLLLKEASMEFARAGVANGDVIFLQAKVARLQGQLPEAAVLADAALRSPDKLENAHFLVQVHLLRADLACDAGNGVEAETELLEAEKLLKRVSDTNTRAQFAGVSGRLLLLKGDSASAAAQLDVMADTLRRAGNHREMVAALQAAAQAYAKVGQFVPAVDRYFRAARALFAGGQVGLARQVIQQTLPLTDRIQDPDIKEQIAALAEEIEAGFVEQQKAAAMEKEAEPGLVKRLTEASPSPQAD